tara:strand:+ start:2839 stop:3324 length:486 start_codon:yes stop_codon:yes gene_type:complete
MIKCLKSLLEKLKVQKYTQSIPSKLESKINLLLIRDTFTEKSTIGQLYLNGELFCDTLENPWKDNAKNISCIPEGEYDVRLRLPRESATREYIHLLVKEVPNRDWILFHRGNTAKDTRGCILVGKGTEQDIVYNSTLSMDLLIKEILHLGAGNIKLIIKNN